MRRPRRSCTSTATNASRPPLRVTTWTWTASLRVTTRFTCTPRPTSSGCCGRCSRRSPSRWWPPPKSRAPLPPTACRRPHQQRLLRPLFETIAQQVVAAAQEQAALAPDGMLSPRLGLFLDEAGNCAALSALDVLATTPRGQTLQLVPVWHDKSQLEARYGPKASTILNNHRAKLFLSGLADLSALELGARLIGDQALTERNRSMGSDGRHSTNESTSYPPLLPVEDLSPLRPGEGVLLYGHLRPTPIRLRPFYAPREQTRRQQAEDRAGRGTAPGARGLGRTDE